MNCQKGDLAVVVRAAKPEWKDGLVRCIEVCEMATLIAGTPVWDVEPLSPTLIADDVRHAPDVCLRPLRDRPGDDESLQWAPRPEQLEALT
jgi:hypothetical protein